MRYAAFVVSLFALSCVRPPDFSAIHTGMTEESVRSTLGKPLNVSAQGNNKIYTYESYHGLDHNDRQFWYVRFVDGVVESYGHMGDFDSTKPPTQKIIIEQAK